MRTVDDNVRLVDASEIDRASFRSELNGARQFPGIVERVRYRPANRYEINVAVRFRREAEDEKQNKTLTLDNSRLRYRDEIVGDHVRNSFQGRGVVRIDLCSRSSERRVQVLLGPTCRRGACSRRARTGFVRVTNPTNPGRDTKCSVQFFESKCNVYFRNAT